MKKAWSMPGKVFLNKKNLIIIIRINNKKSKIAFIDLSFTIYNL